MNDQVHIFRVLPAGKTCCMHDTACSLGLMTSFATGSAAINVQDPPLLVIKDDMRPDSTASAACTVCRILVHHIIHGSFLAHMFVYPCDLTRLTLMRKFPIICIDDIAGTAVPEKKLNMHRGTVFFGFQRMKRRTKLSWNTLRAARGLIDLIQYKHNQPSLARRVLRTESCALHPITARDN